MPVEQAEYRPRTVEKWLEDLANGSLALPRFQRSYVWKNPKISDLIVALLRGHPVGTVLLIDRYREPVNRSTPMEERRKLERFVPRSLSGADSDPDLCRELILDGQQRLTSLHRALEVGVRGGISGNNGTERPAFIEVENLWAAELRPIHVHWPRPAQVAQFTNNPNLAANNNYIPLRLLGPAATAPSSSSETFFHPDQPDALERWCGDVTDNHMSRGNRLLRRINEQLRLKILGRNIWYVKLPPSMDRGDAINVFVKVNESSAVIRRFDIAVAEFDKNNERSLRKQIIEWAEQAPGVDRIFGTDEERVIPKLGELMLKVACLQAGKAPTDSQYTKPEVLAHISNDVERQTIFDGIAWTLGFLREERIWTDRHLPSEVPLRVLPALFRHWRGIDDRSDMTGRVRRILRAYLWRAFASERYESAANTRLQQDFKGLSRVLEMLPNLAGDPVRECRTKVPIFDDKLLPERRDFHNLDAPLAPPTRKDKLSRALLVISLHKGANDFGSGEAVTGDNVGNREAHHLFPRSLLRKNGVESGKKINHCLNYALVSAPTNKKMGAKSPLQYLKDRYWADHGLAEEELRNRIGSHLVPYGALAVREAKPKAAYGEFLKQRATIMHEALTKLTNGKPLM